MGKVKEKVKQTVSAARNAAQYAIVAAELRVVQAQELDEPDDAQIVTVEQITETITEVLI